MELEVEVEQMSERLARDGAHRALTNVGEHGIQQLSKQRCTYASTAICPPRTQSTKCSPNTEGSKATTYMPEQQSRRRPTRLNVRQGEY